MDRRPRRVSCTRRGILAARSTRRFGISSLARWGKLRVIDCDLDLDIPPVERVARMLGKGYLYGSHFLPRHRIEHLGGFVLIATESHRLLDHYIIW